MTQETTARQAARTASADRTGGSGARPWGRRIDCSPDSAPAPREAPGRGAGERLEGDDRDPNPDEGRRREP